MLVRINLTENCLTTLPKRLTLALNHTWLQYCQQVPQQTPHLGTAPAEDAGLPSQALTQLTGHSNCLQCFGSLLDDPDYNSKKAFPCLVLGDLADGLWFLEGTLSAQMRNFHFSYIFIVRLVR